MELGHLLTRSGLTYPEVSSKVCHDSFCLLGNSVSLPWVIYYEAFYLHVVSSFSCIPAICPKFDLIFNSFCNLCICFVIFPIVSCCSSHVFHLYCCYVNKINIKYNKYLDYMSYALKINFAGVGNNTFIQANVVSPQDWIQ